MPAPNRILFFGSAPTVGDAGIGLAILQELRELFPAAELAIATQTPADYEAFDLSGPVGVGPKPRLRSTGGPLAALASWRRLRALRRRGSASSPPAAARAFEGVGLVVFQGGPQGNDVFLHREKLMELDLRVAAAHAAGAPVVLWGQGFGPFAWSGVGGAAKRRWAGRIFRRVDLIATRDARSAPALRKLGVPAGGGRLVEAADAACRLRVGEADERAAGAALERAGVDASGRVLAVCLRDLRGRYGLGDAGHGRLLAAAAGALDAAADRFDRVLFCSTDYRTGRERDSDLEVMEAVRGRMARGGEAAVITEKLGPAVLAALYGRCRVLLAGRLHPAIFAAGRGTPAVMLAYTGKCDDFMRRLGLAEACLPADAATASEIASRLRRVAERPEAADRRLAEGMDAMRADAAKTVAAVARLVGGGTP
ncbi:polysaccharide pyruvyl transferase family protein [Phycisphaera mikurensis]|uniref:Polysaccharide pyruvyl transferase domain-containing protein n=1 Tax=Phycisphaera mikurensis (strain NBRC 102666 / KCTC 22515 / FYK2301M01) TaxID=1142394 RepID=I0IFT5_PHYMF|nr:polysaccharide pyruvyl transferase family protein [Phycisphaera mikurensis]MBB6440488.1 polysaccharide pyruvyl transferase WcaK-like protein [Phycisphaera mikurensis]BAM04123.1 hypothetical protein PSMK_19640 [Phycisphaera mikurensis NBRC 102666]